MFNDVNKDHENGNVLFLILIAVALFAALSYAVTSSNRSGTGVSREAKSLAAAELIQYFSNIENAVVRMRLFNGCEDEDISFHHDSFGHNAYLHSPAQPDKCRVFHPDGGNVSLPKAPHGVLGHSIASLLNGDEFLFLGSGVYHGSGTTCASDSCSDLVVWFSTYDTDLCLSINDQMGSVSYASNTVPIVSSTPAWNGSGHWFNGDFGYHNRVIRSTALEGHATGCFSRSGQDYRIVYHVLIAR